MSRRSKMNQFNYVEPETLQEVRASLPDVEPRPHGGTGKYKDKKNWCRGKIGGRRHTGEVVLRTPVYLPQGYRMCVQNERWYTCYHQLICSNPKCRKVLRNSLDTDCPEYGHYLRTGNRELIENKDWKPPGDLRV